MQLHDTELKRDRNAGKLNQYSLLCNEAASV